MSGSMYALNAAKARVVFDELRGVCESDGGELWGRSLYGLMLLVDQSEGVLVANDPAASAGLDEDDGVFVGPLPADLPIANTAVDWDGRRWSMVIWPVPSDPEIRKGLLVHEAWHRIQADLEISASSPAGAPHLEHLDARVSLRMELSALAAALRSESDGQAQALLAQALSYRAERRSRYPDGATVEEELERNEGLAEYTGRKLAHTSPESAVAEALGTAGGKKSFARSFAYSTGPAYGLLLDRLGPGWRARILEGATLTELAAELAGDATDPDWNAAGRRMIEASERTRANDRAQRDRRWVQLLVTGPVVRLPIGELQTVFDPTDIVGLGEHGTVYPSVQLTDRWGRVVVKDWGALVDPDWKWITLSAHGLQRDAGQVSGRGWELQLNTGWAVEAGPGGHEVVRA